MRLAETQASIRAAIFGDGFATSNAAPAHRLVIHRRHYHASLTTALTTKFPATVWLMGPAKFAEAAAAFVRAYPPTAPCIAEYGEDFPAFIGGTPVAARAPYIADVAKADWHLGQVSIAIANAPLAIDVLASIAPERLPETHLGLQPGLRFLTADWPVDTLIALHLDGNAPEEFVLEPSPVHLQLRGARGTFSIERLDAASLVFRRALKEGVTLGEAAERGLVERNDFDPGGALAALFASGLVVRAQQKPDGGLL